MEFKDIFFSPMLWVMAILLLIMTNFGPYALNLP